MHPAKPLSCGHLQRINQVAVAQALHALNALNNVGKNHVFLEMSSRLSSMVWGTDWHWKIEYATAQGLVCERQDLT